MANNSLLNLATDRMMQSTTMSLVKYSEWHNHILVLKRLIARKVKDVDYITLAHALLNAKVTFNSKEEEENYQREFASLWTVALAFEDIAVFLQENPKVKNIEDYYNKQNKR